MLAFQTGAKADTGVAQSQPLAALVVWIRAFVYPAVNFHLVEQYGDISFGQAASAAKLRHRDTRRVAYVAQDHHGGPRHALALEKFGRMMFQDALNVLQQP